MVFLFPAISGQFSMSLLVFFFFFSNVIIPVFQGTFHAWQYSKKRQQTILCGMMYKSTSKQSPLIYPIIRVFGNHRYTATWSTALCVDLYTVSTWESKSWISDNETKAYQNTHLLLMWTYSIVQIYVYVCAAASSHVKIHMPHINY